MSYLIPHQTSAARALAGVTHVAGPQLNYQFSTLIPALSMELYSASESLEALEAQTETDPGTKHNRLLPNLIAILDIANCSYV
jgi:hypothetical protein